MTPSGGRPIGQGRTGSRRVSLRAMGWLAGVALLAACQGIEGPPPPDFLNQSEAGQVLLRALAAHGGWDKWALRQTAQYHWEQTNRGTKNVWETRLDLPRARVRIDSPSGDVAAGWDGTDAWANPPTAPVAGNARFSLRTELFWFSLPWKFADAAAEFELRPDETRNGVLYRKLRITFPGAGDTPNDYFDAYFNAETGMYEWATFIVTARAPDPQGNYTVMYGEWRDYQEFDGIKIPTLRRFTPWNNGQPGAFTIVNNVSAVNLRGEVLPSSVYNRPPE